MSLLNINAVHTYIQIVQNSKKPLEVIREAIANAYDNGASYLDIIVEYEKEKDTINISFCDDGSGIEKEGIEVYIFGLGNSTKSDSDGYIGNKGVGTLLFLKSKKVTVTSFFNGNGARQIWTEPYSSLLKYRNNIEDVTREDLGLSAPEKFPYSGKANGTKIEIKGFLHKNPLEYHHENLKDFILWFTKIGSFEKDIKLISSKPFIVNLKGLEFSENKSAASINEQDIIDTGKDTFINRNKIKTRESFESIKLGFSFPTLSDEDELINHINHINLSGCSDENIKKEIKKIIKKNLVLKFNSEEDGFEDLKFTYKDSLSVDKTAEIEFVVYRIGETARINHNKMIKGSTNQTPSYKYLVSERYGIYIAKDYIPVQSINSELQSIGGGGHGYTQYLGFFNSQAIDLTIDRTGAATIDEELQIKLMNRINKIMKQIDRKVNDYIEDITTSIYSQLNDRPEIDNVEDNTETTSGNQGVANSEAEAANVSDEQENRNTEIDNNQENNEDNNDTGSTFSVEVQRLERQEKFLRKVGRIHRIKLKKNLSSITLENKKIVISEPNNESELYGVLMQVTTLRPDLLDFSILDYNTTNGIDILARDGNLPETNFSDLFHVELKLVLKTNFNHLLTDAKYIVCWTIHEDLRSRMLLKDKFQNHYRLDRDMDGFVLVCNNPGHTVKIIELKDIIERQFGQFSAN
ncbi:ATP-binding protein [Sporosarcina sp. FSL W8-0480]|uniref:ATP-binding protein n=1 Tax=Sporosarcina sp. FSL W8-0480 TaxID=2954701 RepID=UPI0030D90AF6